MYIKDCFCSEFAILFMLDHDRDIGPAFSPKALVFVKVYEFISLSKFSNTTETIFLLERAWFISFKNVFFFQQLQASENNITIGQPNFK